MASQTRTAVYLRNKAACALHTWEMMKDPSRVRFIYLPAPFKLRVMLLRLHLTSCCLLFLHYLLQSGDSSIATRILIINHFVNMVCLSQLHVGGAIYMVELLSKGN